MDSSADKALRKLRDPQGKAAEALARMMVLEATATPLAEIAEPRWLAGQLATGLEALAHTDRARDLLAQRIEETLDSWDAEERPLGTFLPPEAEAPLREALARPWVPDEGMAMRLIDHGVLRGLMREVLEGTVQRFRARVSKVDQGLLGGVGGNLARRGKGFLRGSVAGNVMSAVKGEVESRMEDLTQDFLDSATREALKVVARHLADPDHAAAYGELRVSVLDTVQQTPVRDLSRELRKLGPMDYADIGLQALRAELGSSDFLDRTEARIRALVAEVGDGTLGAWLDEVGLRDLWVDSTTELLAPRLKGVVAGADFEAWWADLFT